jgi:O-antigen ligase
MSVVSDRGTSLPKRLAIAAALMVPLVVDPFGADTQGMKALVLGLCGAGALAAGALEVLRQPRQGSTSPLPERLLLLLLLWAVVSLSWAGNVGLGVTRVVALLGMYGVARGVRECCSRRPAPGRWLLGLIAVGLAAMGADLLARGPAALSDVNLKHGSVLFVHDNMAASYVTLLVPLILAFALGARQKARAVWWLIVLAAPVLYLGLLRSRAGVLGAGLGIALVGVVFLMRHRLAAWRPDARRWAVGTVLCIVLLAMLPLSDRARGLGKDLFFRGVNTMGFEMGDVVFRPLLWRKTIHLVSDVPLTGVGAGNFAVFFPKYEHQPAPKPHAHNDALQVLAELGIPGLVLLLGLLAATAAALMRVLMNAADQATFTVGAGLLGSLAVFVAGGMFEVPFVLGATGATLAVLIGLAGAMDAGGALPRPASRFARPGAVLGLLVSLGVMAVVVHRLPASAYAAAAAESVQVGDLDRAVEWHGRVAAMRTGAFQPHEALGRLALLRGEPEDALRHFTRSRELSPWNSQLAEAQGDALFQMGRYDDAVQHYQQALDTSPTREEPLFKLVKALDRAGHAQAAIDKLQFKVRSNPGISLDAVYQLSDMWRRRAEGLSGDDRVEALVGARHFLAILLQDGQAERIPVVNVQYKDVTHRLQILPGGLHGWWPVYERFLEQGAWNMPNPALYTSMDADGVKLFPGWKEAYGPPVPGRWRRDR